MRDVRIRAKDAHYESGKSNKDKERLKNGSNRMVPSAYFETLVLGFLKISKAF